MDVPSGEVRRITCRAAICAMPRFIAQHLLPLRMDWPTAPTYSPWAVTNMTLSELPPSPGELPAWDSVVYDGPTLGYVNATHQKLQAVPDATVITHYEALCGKPPAEWRQWMLEQSHAQWCERSLKALAAPHPDLARYVEQMDVWLWGHGMIRPVPGFVSGSTRAAMCQQQPPLFFAHSDMSGLSLFEEAYTRGIEAAEALQTWLGASTT